MTALRHTLAGRGVLGQLFAVEHGDVVEVVGEHAAVARPAMLPPMTTAWRRCSGFTAGASCISKCRLYGAEWAAGSRRARIPRTRDPRSRFGVGLREDRRTCCRRPDRGAGDEAGRLGTEERGDLAEVAGPAEHVCRNTRGQVVEGTGAVQAREPFGLVQSGQQRVDRHAVRCDLTRKRLQETGEPRARVFDRIRPAIGWRTASDVIATTLPHFCARISGTTS